MIETSVEDTQPVPATPPLSSNRLFLLTLLIGMLMGMIVMCLVGYGLYYFGYVSLVDEVATPEVQVTEVKVPVCPTCEPIPDEAKILIVTPTLSPTPDFGATATAACGSFNEQFPGTPCPTAEVP